MRSPPLQTAGAGGAKTRAKASESSAPSWPRWSRRIRDRRFLQAVAAKPTRAGSLHVLRRRPSHTRLAVVTSARMLAALEDSSFGRRDSHSCDIGSAPPSTTREDEWTRERKRPLGEGASRWCLTLSVGATAGDRRAALSQVQAPGGKGDASGVRGWRCGCRRRGGQSSVAHARCGVWTHPRRAGRSHLRCLLRSATRLGDGVRCYANEGAAAVSGRGCVRCCGWGYGQNYCDRPAHRCSDSPR